MWKLNRTSYRRLFLSDHKRDVCLQGLARLSLIQNKRLPAPKIKTFTLQWHLTNACRFHCRHCYDRSERQGLPLKRALQIISDLEYFCKRCRIKAHISFSGGDPLLSPYFWELYRVASEKKIQVSILGNPVSREIIRRLLEIQPPASYQVSLEGLCQHNDYMRGEGHYDQTFLFLKEARKAGLRTHVMLTLTSANLDQVIPLGEQLRGITPRFTFNRLSQVGEAAKLHLPSKQEYIGFLRQYESACRTNPVLACKDNLFNIIQYQASRSYGRGCTGYGCGAAFNFVALLPDGQVHACRKYPSLIGNILNMGLFELYNSSAAQTYREGSLACRQCRIRNVCGGCPAVTYGCGLDPLVERDPYCFIHDPVNVGDNPAEHRTVQFG